MADKLNTDSSDDLALRVALKDANKVKEFLLENKLLDKSRKYLKKDDHIYFPVVREISDVNAKSDSLSKKYPSLSACKLVEQKLDNSMHKETLKELIAKKLGKDVAAKIKTAHDVVGDIAIIEVDDEYADKATIIGEALLKLHKNIRTVLKKSGIHEGEYRTQRLDVVAGENKKETIHTENGVRLKLDVEKVYFSARSATERKRIANFIHPGERVLVMFSGCGPFVFVIAKNSDAKEVIGIEKNPIGHKYALENLALNKSLNKQTNVKFYEGDVRKIVPSLGKFDRIIMPLPKNAQDFLDIALSASKKGTSIHLYKFLDEANIEEDKQKLSENFDVIDAVKCGQFSPGVFRVCFDMIVIKESV